MALPRLTLFGRSILLITFEVAANAICWIIAGILFGKNSETRSVLSLALLAWTLGLRHGAYTFIVTASIHAIDNATRGLINLGKLSVTCGLFFSLGHSTIVIAVNIAIAISLNVYNRIDGVGTVGAIVGNAVSGSFLFVVGLANSIILWRIMKRRRQKKIREQRRRNGEVIEDVADDPKENHMLMMRILGPIVNFVNRPWKMYPVGVLFGFGFDTASSIALLAISALARKGSNESSIPSSHIVILPFLFTAGMTFVDSADSIIMLYSYTGFPERSLLVFSKEEDAVPRAVQPSNAVPAPNEKRESDSAQIIRAPDINDPEKTQPEVAVESIDPPAAVEQSSVAERDTRVKMNVMSGLSIILTLMSILVAFSISIIEIMGLVGQQCGSCSVAAAADDGHGGGLAGRWWRGWANANNQSGFIGVAIVGVFLLIVVVWYGSKWIARKIGGRDVQQE